MNSLFSNIFSLAFEEQRKDNEEKSDSIINQAQRESNRNVRALNENIRFLRERIDDLNEEKEIAWIQSIIPFVEEIKVFKKINCAEFAKEKDIDIPEVEWKKIQPVNKLSLTFREEIVIENVSRILFGGNNIPEAFFGMVKSEEKIAEAEMIAAQTSYENEIIKNQMNSLYHSANFVKEYIVFLKKCNNLCKEKLIKLKDIKECQCFEEDGGKIRFDSLDIISQREIHITYILHEILYRIITQEILSEVSVINQEAVKWLAKGKENIKKLQVE